MDAPPLTHPIPAPPPNTQGLKPNSKFSLPPLDGSLTIPEIYDWHLEHNPSHPIFIYAVEPNSVKTIVWKEAVQAIYSATRLVKDLLKNRSTATTRPVVALLAASDFITSYALITGIIRAGYVVFPISPRNSPAAVAHLLTTTNVEHIFVGPESNLNDLVHKALDLLTIEGDADAYNDNVQKAKIRLSVMPLFEELFENFSPSQDLLATDDKPSMDDPAVILHSSGSASTFPKSITWTHAGLLRCAVTPYYGDRDLTGLRFSCHSVPMFHAMGIFQTLFTPACGVVLTTPKPQTPALPITPATVLKGAVDTASEIMLCVPSFLEAWVGNPIDFENLKKVKAILTGGGPINQEAGDRLVAAGVAVFNVYANTECAAMTKWTRAGVDVDWNYLQVSEQIKAEMEPQGNGLFELVVYSNSPYHIPSVYNDTRGATPVYATNDLFSPHPEKPGYWKVFGRSDDQIMHSTGEKTNPGPLEAILNLDNHISGSVIFGRGRFNAGVIVDPLPEYQFDPADEKLLEEFRNKIWASVEKLNEFAPQHSRIFKEMIMIASPSKPFSYTPKRYPRRAITLETYAPEIESLYAAVEQTSQSDVPPPETWEAEDALLFVRLLVANVMKRSVQDSDDLFQHGCDSLQAMWIRNLLTHALQSTTKVKPRAVGGNVVYAHPTILSLAQYVTQLVEPPQQQDPITDAVGQMESMVSKYSQSFAKHVGLLASPSSDTILVTGTTGGLGTTILAELIASDSVAKIYAVNRNSSSVGLSLLERQKASFRRQGLDPSLTVSPKVTLLMTDIEESNLGLPSDVYRDLCGNVTHIIHNAWRVDFNLSLTSFEPQVKGVRNLVDLALSSPYYHPTRLLFISSIGVLRKIETPGLASESAVAPVVAVGSGYSESKWVSERILELAASSTPLKPTIVRIAQICGGPNGFWNTKEWLPSLIRSSLTMRCLPTCDQSISWIPSSLAAQAIAEMRSSTEPFLHLAHPQPVVWSAIFKDFSSLLKLPLISFDEWVANLEEQAALEGSHDLDKGIYSELPALALFDFFKIAMRSSQGEKEAMETPKLSLQKARQASQTLNDDGLPRLGSSDVQKWVAFWRSVRFLQE